MIKQIEPIISQQELQQLTETIRSTIISSGPKTEVFEKKIAKLLEVKYAVAVPNGTLALTIACLALGIGSDDEVIIPDLTMAGTANGVILAGGKPVFCDIKETDLTVDPDNIIKLINSKTKAIMPVHLNGRAADMPSLIKLAQMYKLFIIEDAAQAFASKLDSKFLGTIGDIGCFSFSVPKIITTGQGGMVVTNNQKYYQKILKIIDHGRRKKGKDIHDEIGFNFKFTDLAAAVGLVQLKRLKRHILKKLRLLNLYQKYLQNNSHIKFIRDNQIGFVPWFIDIKVNNRTKLIKHLKKVGIETRPMYPPLHTQKAYTSLNSKTDKFPVTQELAEKILWLPSSVSLSEEEIKFICKKINDFYETCQ